jgi:hypothetical protein
VLRLGRSPAPPPAPSYSTRRPQPERRSSFPSLALSRACHAVLRLCRRRLAVAVALPVRAPLPHLFWFKSSTTSLSSHSILAPALYLPRTPSTTAAISSDSGALLLAVGSPFAVLPAPPQPLRKFPRTPLTFTSHLPRSDLHRSYLAAVRPFAGKLLPPLSSCLRPSSAQFDDSNSFPTSSCSC